MHNKPTLEAGFRITLEKNSWELQLTLPSQQCKRPGQVVEPRHEPLPRPAPDAGHQGCAAPGLPPISVCLSVLFHGSLSVTLHIHLARPSCTAGVLVMCLRSLAYSQVLPGHQRQHRTLLNCASCLQMCVCEAGTPGRPVKAASGAGVRARRRHVLPATLRRLVLWARPPTTPRAVPPPTLGPALAHLSHLRCAVGPLDVCTAPWFPALCTCGRASALCI